NGLFYCGHWNFFLAQIFVSLVVGCGAADMVFLIFKVIDHFFGLRVPKRIEEEGLDIYEHGESAYNN
ncbi:MAG: ammonium transporter, partial [Porphyromonadaceae bacterium]|nr:ammonium transporter [Porphyromonadaceae bacterium]